MNRQRNETFTEGWNFTRLLKSFVVVYRTAYSSQRTASVRSPRQRQDHAGEDEEEEGGGRRKEEAHLIDKPLMIK